MRIIAGELKGRQLKAVSGLATRPTTDRVREAWASTVGSLLPDGFNGLSVLDAFAGSGALGLEALSRGAARLCLCENDRRALALLRENLSGLLGGNGGDASHGGYSAAMPHDGRSRNAPPGGGGDTSRVRLLAVDVFAPTAIKQLKGSAGFDLIILDPPYSVPVGRVKGLLHALATSGCLNSGALVSYEHRAGEGGGTGQSQSQNQGLNSGQGQDKSRTLGRAGQSQGLDGAVLCAACSPASLQMVSCKSYGSTEIEYLFYR